MLVEAFPLGEDKLPVIHCYCFAPKENTEQDLENRLREILGGRYPSNPVSFRWVRNVAPKKDMYCVEFQLDKDLGCRKKRTSEELDLETPRMIKKQKSE